MGRTGRLPREIARILEEPFNPPLEAAARRGERVIGYTCQLLPEPLLSVEGLVPFRIRIPDSAGTPLADTYLSSVICSYPRQILETTLEGGLEFIDGWVLTTSCDHLRRLYDNLIHLTSPAVSHIVDIPHRCHEDAVTWFAEELEILADKLSQSFGVETSERAILKSVDNTNHLRSLLREVGDLRMRDAPPLTGGDMLRLTVASQVAPREATISLLEEVRDQLADDDFEGPEARARLMVVGGPIDDPRYLDAIESVGAVVVADRFCWGSMPGLEPLEAHPGSVIRDLAHHQLRASRCPRMMGRDDLRLGDLERIFQQYRVDGMIIEAMKFCDLWGVEAVLMHDDLRSRGIPVLRLDREYAFGGEGQLRTRVQAFLESMGR